MTLFMFYLCKEPLYPVIFTFIIYFLFFMLILEDIIGKFNKDFGACFCIFCTVKFLVLQLCVV